MSAEENKERVRRLYEEAYGEGKVQVVDEVLHSVKERAYPPGYLEG